MVPNLSILKRFSRDGETWPEIVARVSSSLGSGSRCAEYRDAIKTGELIPAGQILRWAGRPTGILYNCFVTDADARESAHEIATRITEWTARGCGVGVNVSRWCRADKRDQVTALQEIVATIAQSQQTLWERGETRTATMINVDFNVPGIDSVCTELASNPTYRHLNLGVIIDDSSLAAAVNARHHKEPHPALDCFVRLAATAWQSGNPGLIFKDRVNRDHPFSEVLEACNPCAEQHLLPNEGCNLASINLAALVVDRRFDLDRFRAVVRTGVRFLDAVIDNSDFPSETAARLAAKRRRIGLGVTGFGSALRALRIGYDTPNAVTCAEQWAAELRAVADAESQVLAAECGPFIDSPRITAVSSRNSNLLSIAPAGAISMLWGVSSGIEPIFAPYYKKGSLDVFEPNCDATVRGAYSIDRRWHVRIAAAWQKHVDGGISKTVNLPADTTIDDVVNAFIDAWQSQCKGVSVFRDGSRQPALVVDRTIKSLNTNLPITRKSK